MERQRWRPPRRAAAEPPEPERCAPAGSPEASAPSRPRCWPAPARAVERPTAAAALGGRARRQARRALRLVAAAAAAVACRASASSRRPAAAPASGGGAAFVAARRGGAAASASHGAPPGRRPRCRRPRGGGAAGWRRVAAARAVPPGDGPGRSRFTWPWENAEKRERELAAERENKATLEFFRLELGIISAVLVAAGVIFVGFYELSETVYTGRSGNTYAEASKSRGEIVFEQWYLKATEASKKAKAIATRAQEKLEDVTKPQPSSGPLVVSQSVVDRIRAVAQLLDLFQQDIYDELWIGLGTYPNILRGYVPLLEYYADAAYPVAKQDPVLESTREALIFEVGKFRKAADELDRVLVKRNIRDVERTFADLSLSYDRYLKAGSLYAGYDPVTSTTVYYENIDDTQLRYTPLSIEQPRIRDEVLIIQGPDKGKVGKVIWLGRNGEGNADPEKIVSAVVKLSSNPMLGGSDGKGFKEVKAFPYTSIAVTRTSDQNFALDVILGGLAAIFSCALTYPLDSIKARIQGGLPLLPPEGPAGLFSGLTFNLWREVPNQAIYLAMFNYLTRYFCTLPYVDANDPNLKLLVMIPAGVIGFISGSPFRAPFTVLNRQLQMGFASTNEQAITNVFYKPSPDQVLKNIYGAWLLIVLGGIPFGAFQCTFYEFFKDRLELVEFGVPLGLQPFVNGALAGFLTGILTNPPDRMLATVTQMEAEMLARQEALAAADKDADSAGAPGGGQKAEKQYIEEISVFDKLGQAITRINEEEGWKGFFKGAEARALYFAPEACLWFAAYEYLRSVADLISEV